MVSAILSWLQDLCPFRRMVPAAGDVPVGLLELDDGGNCRSINQRWVRLSGLDQARSEGRGWLLAVHPDDQTDVLARWYGFAARNGNFDAVFRLCGVDGDVLWVQGSAVAKTVGTRDDAWNVMAVTDITQRRQAEMATSRSEAWMRGVLAAANDGIVVFDGLGLIQELNPAAERLFGWAADDVRGRRVGILLAESEVETQGRAFTGFGADTTDGALPSLHRLMGRHKDGQTFPVEMSVGVFPGGAGRSFVGVARSLPCEEQPKDDYVLAVSHVMRTPLTAIQGALSLMQGAAGRESSERMGHLHRVAERNCARLVELVDSIIDIDLIRSGRMPLTVKRIVLQELIGQAIDEAGLRVDPSEEDQEVVIRLVACPPDVSVYGDPLRLRQALGQLLTNAIRFTPPGGAIEVAVTVRGPQVRVSVTDFGDGLPDSIKSRVFQQFFLSDGPGTQGGVGGPGLGLALTKAIIEAHRGRIGFDSLPGSGTTFWFDLGEAGARDQEPPDDNGHHADGRWL